MNHNFNAPEAKARRRAQLRRGMYLLPSLFTAGSLALGFFSIMQTIEAISRDTPLHLDWAAIAILIAIPFDALDGRIARMTNTASDFGKEFDSLADVISFGVAPSLLAYVWGIHFLPDSINPQLRQHLVQAGVFICFLFLLSGASRLARFNISHDAQPRNPGRPDRKYFVGMPIPAAAGFLAASVHLCFGIPIEDWWWWVAIPWLILVGLCGFLMVSTWRFWSAKEINFSRRHPFQLLVPLAIIVYVMIRYSNTALFLLALAYLFSGIWARAAYGWSRRRRKGSATAHEPSVPVEPESMGPRFLE